MCRLKILSSKHGSKRERRKAVSRCNRIMAYLDLFESHQTMLPSSWLSQVALVEKVTHTIGAVEKVWRSMECILTDSLVAIGKPNEVCF